MKLAPAAARNGNRSAARSGSDREHVEEDDARRIASRSVEDVLLVRVVDARLDRGRRGQDEGQHDAAVAAGQQALGRVDHALGLAGDLHRNHCRRRPRRRLTPRRDLRAHPPRVRTPPRSHRPGQRGRHRSRATRRRPTFVASRAMDATIETHGVTKRYGERSRSTICRSPFGRGWSPASSARTAPGRRRRCRCCSGSPPPTPARR